MKSFNIISMMSGTSMDGVDALLVNIDENYNFKFIDNFSLEYSVALKQKLMSAALNMADTRRICSLNFEVGYAFAECANKLINKNKDIKIDFISSHGQTIYHLPIPENNEVPSTLQIGDISVIAEKTGCMTIGDFRTKDISAGGQGAPLVPFADEIIFGRKTPRIIQNIGGISNATILSKKSDTFAFDNSVGNMFIDYCAKKFFNTEYDKNGEFASLGEVNYDFLDILLKDEYFKLQPPKTTGREHFNKGYFETKLDYTKLKNIDKYSIIRTVTELTAVSIYNSYIDFIFPKTDISEVVLCGGGAYNPVIFSSLKEKLNNIKLLKHSDFGINDKFKECLAFAILGLCTYLKRTNNLPKCTGALKNVIMGKISYPD